MNKSTNQRSTALTRNRCKSNIELMLVIH